MKTLGVVGIGTWPVFSPSRGGGSEWLTAQGDAQRTSWIRTDAAISVEALSKPGFDLQWKVKLENQTRHTNGLAQGVTANGVTLFIPLSLVTGSSNNVYSIDNDTGYLLWQRHFDSALPAATAAWWNHCGAFTRIVRLRRRLRRARGGGGGGRERWATAERSEPGQGIVVEARGGARTRVVRRRRPVAPAGAAGAGAPPPAGRRPRAPPQPLEEEERPPLAAHQDSHPAEAAVAALPQQLQEFPAHPPAARAEDLGARPAWSI
jgi:hypothetical protein